MPTTEDYLQDHSLKIANLQTDHNDTTDDLYNINRKVNAVLAGLKSNGVSCLSECEIKTIVECVINDLSIPTDVKIVWDCADFS
jgi:hypothetical protein